MEQERFLDEQIIELINQVEKPTQRILTETEQNGEIQPEKRTIYTGIRILGKIVEFEPRLLLSGQMSMMIPKGFMEIGEETAKMKYPSEQRPPIILSDHTGTVNILLNHMEDAMETGDAEEVRDNVMGVSRRVNPGIKPQSTGMEIISDKNVAYIEFSNPVMDGKLYNLMFFMEVGGRILMGSFNCRTKDMKYWQKPAFEMMKSIQVIKLGESVVDE